MTPAAALTNELLLAMQRAHPEITLWRNNTGAGVGWSIVKKACALIRAGKIVEGLKLLSRPIFFGMKGSSDLVGLSKPFGRWIGIEVKASGDESSDDQESFAHLVTEHGGVYLICRNVDECVAELERHISVRHISAQPDRGDPGVYL